MTSSGGNRFIRIVVDRERIDSDWQLVGAIGHELQHAIEVLSDRFVTNGTKMFFFYRRYAPTGRDRFETLDATNAGTDVERELREWRREASPCSALPAAPGSNKVNADPAEWATGKDLSFPNYWREFTAEVVRCLSNSRGRTIPPGGTTPHHCYFRDTCFFIRDAAEDVPMIAIMWQFEVKHGQETEFEQLYGVDGEWTAMNRHARSYLGSSFLRDQSRSSRYIVIEYWSEIVVYEQHRAYRTDAIASLENRSRALVDSVEPLGVFSALNVPDRFGPTWSQRK
jgi:hypothetical protein